MRGVSLLRFLVRWIVLALLGWLTYVLVSALLTVVYLDVPWYDWLWYLLIVALLVGLQICLVLSHLRWLNSRRVRGVAFIVFAPLLIALLVGYDGFGLDARLVPDRGAMPPISFWASPAIAESPDAVLHDVRAAGGRLYLGVSETSLEREGGRALTTAIRRLAEFNIDVYLATPAGDDFLSVPVYRDWIARTRQAATLVQREGLTNVRGFIGDAEMPLSVPLDVVGAEREIYDRAVVEYTQLINTLHRDTPDLQIGVTALWAQYVDRVDGDADLAVAMRSPVDPPGGWDFVNLMTYSSYVALEGRAYYVYVLERAMARLYPNSQVSYLIGLVGGGMPGEPLLDFDDLVHDARLSRALGVRELVVFQLDGALQAFGQDFVRRVTAAINAPLTDSMLVVPFSRPISIEFYGIAAADAVLDVFGPRAWLGLAWLAATAFFARNPRAYG